MNFKDALTEVKRFTSLNPRIKKALVDTLPIVVFFEIIKILPPYIFARIIDTTVEFDANKGLTLEIALFLTAGYFLSLLFMTIVEVGYMKVSHKRIFKAENSVLKSTVKKLFSLDINYHEEKNTGANVSKIIRGSFSLVELLFATLDRVYPILIQAVVTFIVLFFVSPQISIIFVLFVPFFLFLMLRNSQKSQKYRDVYHSQFHIFAGKFAQALINIRTVKDFHNEDKELSKCKPSLNKFYKNIELRHKNGIKSTFIEQGTVNLARVLTLAFGVWLLFKGSLTPGQLVFVVTLSEKGFINLIQLHKVYYRMQDASPAIERFHDIFNSNPNIQNLPSKNKIINGDIEFQNVDFRYDTEKHLYALKGVSFKIPSKSTIAFVGRSGAGKSTLIKLLFRHNDATNGHVLIDNKSIKDYSLGHLRESIGIVSQDVELFNESILQNIAYGVKKVKKDEVIRAAKMAHAHDFIMELKKGYDTVIGERGVRLSGGQKQRIAIARAILRKPKILVFDEATSALDAESEKFIHQAIFDLTGKVTLILIAHRFATIEHADKIILLEKGMVKEEGKHRELVRKKGIFAKLRKLQQLGELDQ